MKKIAVILGIVILLVLVAALAIPFLVDASRFRPVLEERFSQRLGREVKVADVRLSVLPVAVTARDLSIGDDPAFSKGPFLRASALRVGLELVPLIREHKLKVTGIRLEKPDVDLIQNAEGVWNFSSLGGDAPPKAATPRAVLAPSDTEPSAIPSVSIADIRVSDGRVTLRKLRGKAKPVVLDKVAMEVQRFSPGSSFPLTLTAALPAGGTLKLDGTAGPINAGDAIQTPFTAKLAGSHLDLAASGLLDPSDGVAGVASIEGSAQSEQSNVVVRGKLKAEQLKLAKGGSPAKRAVEVDFNVAHDLRKLAGTVRSADIHFGSAIATITGVYRLQSEPGTVSLKLSGSKMPATELAALLPALDVVLPAGASVEGGTAQVNLAFDGPADKLLTTGTISAENIKLANYDLASKLKTIEALAGIKAEPHTTIQTLSANVKNSPEGTALDNIQLVVPSIGNFAGGGTVSPSHELNFRMRVMVQSALVSMVPLGSKNGIPFTISGTANNPSFQPDVKGIATDQLKDLSGSAGAASGLIDSLFGGKKKKP